MRQKDGALNQRTGLSEFRLDGGSGTILALAAVSMAICLFSLSQVVAVNLISQRRLQTTVDAMAIGAADALRGLNTGFPCPTAVQIGQKNGVGLDTCRIVNFEVFISAHSKGVGIVLSANALAGPSY